MHPYLSFNLAGHGFDLRSYSVFMLAGAVIAIGTGCIMAVRCGLPVIKTLVWLAITAIVMLPGARIMFAVTHLGLIRSHPESLWIWQPIDFSLYGGLILAILIGGQAAWLLKLPLWRMADAVVIGLALGLAVMRVGCYLNGCCFGKVTGLPWGVSFPPGSLAHNYQLAIGEKVPLLFGLPLLGSLPVHPTQLYEMTAALLGAALAYYIMRRRAKDGIAFLSFVVWFTGFRLLDHFLRSPSLHLSSAPFLYPLLYSSIIIIAITLMISITKDKRNSPCYQERKS